MEDSDPDAETQEGHCQQAHGESKPSDAQEDSACMGTTYVEQAEELEEVSPGHRHPSPHMQWQAGFEDCRQELLQGREDRSLEPSRSFYQVASPTREGGNRSWGLGGTHRSGGRRSSAVPGGQVDANIRNHRLSTPVSAEHKYV